MTTVVISHRTPAGVDSNGDPVTSTTTVTTVDGVTMEPTQPTEQAAPADAAVVRYTLRCPIDTDVARGDTVTWRGETFRVHTTPEIWEDPWAGPKVEGLEVVLQRAEVTR